MVDGRRIPRRWKVVLWIVGAVVVGVGGVVLALVLSNPSLSVDLASDVSTRDIPASWLSSDRSTVEPPDAQAVEVSSGTIAPRATTGRLALLANGRPFGEEAYELRIAEEGVTLTSSGRFWFKVVLATVQVTFEQTLEADGDLRPATYVAEFHAPLGFDRSIRATLAGDRLLVERSGEREEIRIEAERTFTLGTFSTYVLLPHLFALHQDNGSASFEVLVFGGPPSQEVGAATDTLPTMTVESLGGGRLRAGNLVLDVDRYRVSSPLGESELYARGNEFLALRAGDEGNSLWVYRSDFFPNGIEIVSEAPLP